MPDGPNESPAMRTARADSWTVAERYSGAGQNVLGGYLAGLMVARLDGAGSVTLRAPLAAGSRVTFVPGAPDRLLDAAGTLVAEATPLGSLDIVPPVVSLEEARHAAADYPGRRSHLFPTCFCCGTGREADDGLGIFPGPLSDGVVAAPWTSREPSGSACSRRVLPEIVSSALDCPAIWALICAADPGTHARAVTGRLEIRIDGAVEAGRPYVVVGWPLGSDGRKRYAGAAVEAEDGRVLAIARQTMVVTGDGIPLGLDHWASGRP